ncbi:AraC family transcriptional regulator [Mangrovivirga cuniculi]|uniref:HTH araC/xylS-type domain-containing protein n=1 Tax=Mangrovivirga cuniculi TaxID=2715131 RepID=A0A4D7JRL6_9BACT|nr:helix-turn-helix domain-containing protein [Mangrovivirga cuniculi]QCK16170.1 hypothetical protein DCC35_16180 [Mangrovivirga cuniculi]
MDLELFIVSAGCINALILLMALSALKGKIKRASRLLGLFIFSYFISLTNWIIIPPIAFRLGVLPFWLPSLFFIAPLGYFFFRAIDNPTFKIKGLFLLFFLPGILDVIFHIIQYIYFLLKIGNTYVFMMNRGFVYFMHDGIAIIFNLICFVFVLKFVFTLRHVEAPAKKFYRLFVVFMGYMTVRWVTFYLLDLFNPKALNSDLFLGAWVLEMIGLLIIGYKGLIDSRLFNIRQQKNSSITTSEINKKSKLLLEILNEKKLYLKPDLNRKDLAEELGTSEVTISHILNKGLGTGFYPLVNRYRALEVIRMLKAGDHHSFTLETLARKAGFGSLTTFNKAFKSETGLTPKGYLHTIN